MSKDEKHDGAELIGQTIPDMAGTESRLTVGEARDNLNTQLRCMADEIRAWGTVVDAKVDDAIDELIAASARTERANVARLRLDVPVTADELDWVEHAASLRSLSVVEYVRRAINLSLCKEGVDAVLLKESDENDHAAELGPCPTGSACVYSCTSACFRETRRAEATARRQGDQMKTDMDTTRDDGKPCDECGEDAVLEIQLQGHHHTTALCGRCADDAITTCPGCEQNIWCKDGTRVYQSASLYCASCCAQHPVIAAILDRALRLDASRDEFQQARR